MWQRCMFVARLIVIATLITVMSFGKYSGSKKAVDLLTIWLDMDISIYPYIHISIYGHADNMGNMDFDMDLWIK